MSYSLTIPLLINLPQEPSEEVIGVAKLLCALLEHSSEWIVARLAQLQVQAFLTAILRVTGWQGLGGVHERVSEVCVTVVFPWIVHADLAC